jgi:hypothetical protein
MPDKPLDINILSEDGGPATLAEVQADFKRRRYLPGWKSGVLFLALAATPMLYAAAMLLLSDDLNADWFGHWVDSSAGFSSLLAETFPGLAAGSTEIYGNASGPLADFMNFASIDILCAIATFLVVFGLGPAVRINPKPDSPQLGFLRNLGKGFPAGRRMNSRRVGGKVGGLCFALLLASVAGGLLYFFFLQPLFVDGQIFVNAHQHCTASEGVGKHSHCVAYGDNTLTQTIWKLGWMFSLAAFAWPIALWILLACLSYPRWMLRADT